MKVLSLIFVVVSLLAASDAHPGGLDANGGHYNRKTDKYHYHRKPVKQTSKVQSKKRHTGSAQQAKPTIKAVGIIVLVKGMPVIPQVV